MKPIIHKLNLLISIKFFIFALIKLIKMKFQRIARSLIMLLACLLFTFNVQATHGIGGEIIVEHIVQNTYRVKLSLYRDCGGISLLATQNINVSHPNFNTTMTLNRTAINDISSVCASQVTNCNSSSSTISGVEEHVYEVIQTFNPIPPSVPYYTLSWVGCCRSAVVSNLINPNSQGTRLELRFYKGIDPIPDNSPIFLNPPTSQYCVGQPAAVSVNAFDPDGDVIRYKLVDALEQNSNSVMYSSTYSGVAPLPSSTPIVIDSLTGLLTFTPTIIGRYVVAIQATEYRNGIEYGYVRREVEIVVSSCGSNSVPQITPLASAIVNDGMQYCVPVAVTDADGDTLDLTALSAILPPATFVVDSFVSGATYGTFCFTPTIADRGNTYTVSLLANDKVCPIPASSVTSFNITVPDICSLGLTTSVTPTAVGQSFGTASAQITNGIFPYSYSWSGPNNYIGNGDSLLGLEAGVYYVSATDGNNCAILDSVEVLSNASTLPVFFIGISASFQNEDVLVLFETQTEIDITHFEVQRSNNGLNFTTINSLEAKGGSRYDFLDQEISQSGLLYYRIVAFDKDGKLSYSDIVSINVQIENEISIYPTIIKGSTLKIKGLTNVAGAELRIYDVMGRLVFSTAISNDFIVELPPMRTGTYNIAVLKGGIPLKQQRISIIE